MPESRFGFGGDRDRSRRTEGREVNVLGCKDPVCVANVVGRVRHV